MVASAAVAKSVYLAPHDVWNHLDLGLSSFRPYP